MYEQLYGHRSLLLLESAFLMQSTHVLTCCGLQLDTAADKVKIFKLHDGNVSRLLKIHFCIKCVKIGLEEGAHVVNCNI